MRKLTEGEYQSFLKDNNDLATACVALKRIMRAPDASGFTLSVIAEKALQAIQVTQENCGGVEGHAPPGMSVVSSSLDRRILPSTGKMANTEGTQAPPAETSSKDTQCFWTGDGPCPECGGKSMKATQTAEQGPGNSPAVKDAIKKTIDELSAMSPEEFRKKLDEVTEPAPAVVETGTYPYCPFCGTCWERGEFCYASCNRLKQVSRPDEKAGK